MAHNRLQTLRELNGAVGSKAALTAPKCDFRCTPESGLKSDMAEGLFRARSGSQPTLFNHLVSASKNARPDDGPLITKFVPHRRFTGDRRAWSLQFFVHSSTGSSANTSQPGPATRA